MNATHIESGKQRQSRQENVTPRIVALLLLALMALLFALSGRGAL